MPNWVQSVAFDVSGLALLGAAIAVGILHGTASPDFAVFISLGGTYLGAKGYSVANPTTPSTTSKVTN